MGCGTDTGNPGGMSRGLHGDHGGPIFYFANNFRDNICTHLDQCLDNVIHTECRTYFSSLNNLNTRLGFKEDDYKTFTDIFVAEFKNIISIDKKNAILCIEEIKSLSCEDPNVKGAYDENQTNPYIGIKYLIPESCSYVYLENKV